MSVAICKHCKVYLPVNEEGYCASCVKNIKELFERYKYGRIKELKDDMRHK